MSSILYSILISTEKPIFDINDNLIKAGIYILEITHFKDNGIIKGFIKNIGRENK